MRDPDGGVRAVVLPLDVGTGVTNRLVDRPLEVVVVRAAQDPREEQQKNQLSRRAPVHGDRDELEALVMKKHRSVREERRERNHHKHDAPPSIYPHMTLWFHKE